MQDYKKNLSLNQSRLKKILSHPKAFLYDDWDGEKLPKESLIIGNAVDCLITEPDTFETRFLIVQGEFSISNGMYKTFLENLFLTRLRLDSEVDAITKDEWYSMSFEKSTTVNTKFKLENFISDFEGGKGKDFYDYLLETSEKEVLSVEQKERSIMIANSLKNSVFTGGYFKYPDIKYQVEIFWTFEEFDIKSKLDMVVIDHEHKTLTPIDVKTTEKVNDFKTVVKLRRYDFQAACYTKALESWRDVNYPGYSIGNFLFLVESSKYPGNPMIFRVSNETLERGLNGGVWDNVHYDGFTQAIERYRFHSDYDLWDYRMEEYRSNGIVDI